MCDCPQDASTSCCPQDDLLSRHPHLIRTAEKFPLPLDRLPCPETVEQRISCKIHEVNGVRYQHCVEVLERIRRCAGRPPEIIETTKRETSSPCGLSRASGIRLEDNHPSSSGASSVLNPELGMMFDEFFCYANHLKSLLEDRGAISGSQPLGQSVDASPVKGSEGLLQRWFRRDPPTSSDRPGAGVRLPGLGKLSEQYAQEVREI